MALLGRLLRRPPPDWWLPLVRYLSEARLRDVIDTHVLLREAVDRGIAPAQLLRDRAPLRAVVLRAELVRLAAAGLRIVSCLSDRGFRPDIGGLVRGFYADLDPPSSEGIARDLAWAAEGLPGALAQASDGTLDELPTDLRDLATGSLIMGHFLAEAFLAAWAAGERQPQPPAACADQMQGVLFDADRLERVWLRAVAGREPRSMKTAPGEAT